MLWCFFAAKLTEFDTCEKVLLEKQVDLIVFLSQL